MNSSGAKTALTFAFGVSLCGVTGYMLYLLLKRDEQDDRYSDTIPTTRSYNKTEIKIPLDNVRTVIGRNGSHIKEIEKESNTKINFKDRVEEENFRICVIRGSSDNCHKAESLIHQFIANQPVIESKDLWVPQIAVARIIGRCGERIHCISDLSGAKIRVTPESGSSDVAERKILLKGTKEQIEIASKCIMDVVHEDADFRLKMSKREPRGKKRNKQNSGSSGESSVQKKVYEKLSNGTSSSNMEMEVYVSAVVDPSQFWLQIVGPKANELDQLVEEMTDYYSKPENRELHIIDEPIEGEIVAAIFMFDGKWYRAEIAKVVTDDDGKKMAQLYYVDYGDTDVVPVDEVFELRTDFLILRFQAIECFLARVKPRTPQWTEEAIDRFEEWTQVAQWKKLRARVNTYRDRRNCVRSRREGSPIPGVDLYDVNNQKDVDIAAELVKHGYATFEFSNSSSLEDCSTASYSGSYTATPHTSNITPKSTQFSEAKAQANNVESQIPTKSNFAPQDKPIKPYDLPLSKTNNVLQTKSSPVQMKAASAEQMKSKEFRDTKINIASGSKTKVESQELEDTKSNGASTSKPENMTKSDVLSETKSDDDTITDNTFQTEIASTPQMKSDDTLQTGSDTDSAASLTDTNGVLLTGTDPVLSIETDAVKNESLNNVSAVLHDTSQTDIEPHTDSVCLNSSLNKSTEC